MRKEIVDLVEGVRSLKIARTGHPAPHCVKIGVPAPEFPVKLEELQAALERLDASGGLGRGVEDEDVSKLRDAVNGVFRWIRMQGLSADEPMRILSETLSGKPQKKQQAFEMLPKYAVTARKKKMKWKPKLSYEAELGDRHLSGSDLKSHAKLSADMQQTILKMGEIMPDPDRDLETESAPSAVR